MNGHLEATMSGGRRRLVQEKRKTVEIHIKDVLWFSGLPCRLLSAVAIILYGSGFVNSGYRRSHITFRRGEPRIELE